MHFLTQLRALAYKNATGSGLIGCEKGWGKKDQQNDGWSLSGRAEGGDEDDDDDEEEDEEDEEDPYDERIPEEI